MRFSPIQWALGGLLTLAWGVLMFIQIHHYCLPSMDSWCYFAPAAFAKAPLELTTPLLANFENSDGQWGLNWPGGVLLLSLATSFLPRSPALYTLLVLAQWLLLSLLTCAWLRLMVRKPLILVAALLFGLCLRHYFFISMLMRHELLACIALLGAAYGVYATATSSVRRPLAFLILIVSFFFIPLFQPASLLAGAALLAFLALQWFWSQDRLALKYLPAATAAYGAGLLAFFLYYRLQPEAWAAFQEHGRYNASLTYDGHYFFGKTFLLSCLDKSVVGNTLVFLIALAVAAAALPTLIKSIYHRTTRLDTSPLALTLFLYLALLGATQFTYNGYYLVLAAPFAIVLMMVGVDFLSDKIGSRASVAIPIFLTLILLPSIATYAIKTNILRRAGISNFRQELSELHANLPPAGHLYIPTIMWENALVEPDRYTLSALPYNGTREHQEKYEAYILKRVQSGDLLLIDRLGDNPPHYTLDESQWEKIGSKTCRYVTSKERGFDITIWRRK